MAENAVETLVRIASDQITAAEERFRDVVLARGLVADDAGKREVFLALGCACMQRTIKHLTRAGGPRAAIEALLLEAQRLLAVEMGGEG